jgi:hypothetical protein
MRMNDSEKQLVLKGLYRLIDAAFATQDPEQVVPTMRKLAQSLIMDLRIAPQEAPQFFPHEEARTLSQYTNGELADELRARLRAADPKREVL